MPAINVSQTGVVYPAHVLDVSVKGASIPAASQDAFLKYKHVQWTLLDKQLPTRSFVPYANTSNDP